MSWLIFHFHSLPSWTFKSTFIHTLLSSHIYYIYSSYRGVKSVEVRRDDEENVPYVLMQDPKAAEISFVRAQCPSKQVMYVRCSELGKKSLLFSLYFFFFSLSSLTSWVFLYFCPFFFRFFLDRIFFAELYWQLISIHCCNSILLNSSIFLSLIFYVLYKSKLCYQIQFFKFFFLIKINSCKSI